MMEQKNFHMTPDEFRRQGRAVVDWIADYYERVESFPVLSQVKPGEIRACLNPEAPMQGEAFEKILADVENLLPGVTHWQSPNFFAYFPANTSGPSILAELLSAGLGVQGMLWATSPACTELETHVLDWLVDALALPRKFKSSSMGGGTIQDSASSAALCALLAARERVTQNQINARGVSERLVAYASTQTHSSVEKGVGIIGIGRKNLRLIAVDENFAMRADELEKQMQTDRAAGLVPFFVCATIGTTSSNALDPLFEIGRICRDAGVWLHVDAAMAGTAAICPEYQTLNDGVEFADSYSFNPHKWMFTNFDCNCFYVADRAALIHALSILPEYLRNQATESGAVFDYRDWQISLGRRFRSLKLWFVLRYYGIEGLRYHVRQHIALAQNFAAQIRQAEKFELVAPAPLNLVCFRHVNGDAFNRQLLERLNASGRVYLTHTILNGQYALRLCVGQTSTQERHVAEAWRLIQQFARELEGEK
ncbi:MAG: aspartate aminotransferase family protein [Chloroflexi bacterium UTCFX4]|nr:MAG: aspartate aminotransferase family protein [Chloroflexi bacterium UTCFX4]